MKWTDVPPFINKTVYGPTYHVKEDRYMVTIACNITKKKTSMAYARFLMCVMEGRILRKDEHVDHDDNNRKNDHPKNLKIISVADNNRKAARPESKCGTLAKSKRCKCNDCTRVLQEYRKNYNMKNKN
jgi:hypothetical protein